jgi:hypothetical protein
MPRVEVTPYFPNTTQEAYYSDTTGDLRQYIIAPVEGYVLRDNAGDWDEIINFETMETVRKEAYYRGTISVGKNYDFAANPREIEAVLESTVPADQIFGGGGNNDHEVM